MPEVKARSGAIAIVVGVAIAGCSVFETRHETVTLPVREKAETRACDSPIILPNLADLPACGDGKGHCFPAEQTIFDAENLEDCPSGGSCLPDKYLTMNGKKATSCTFHINGKPGACVSLLLKDIAANKDALRQENCEPDERCAPCNHPIEGFDTKLCGELGPHEKACASEALNESPAETCCHGMGVCMKTEDAPAESRDDMPRDVCPEEKVCAPAAMVDGKTKTCDVLGIPGVCLDVCFAAMLRGTTQVTRADCGPTELCLPCVIGKGQGMPGCD